MSREASTLNPPNIPDTGPDGVRIPSKSVGLLNSITQCMAFPYVFRWTGWRPDQKWWRPYFCPGPSGAAVSC